VGYHRSLPQTLRLLLLACRRIFIIAIRAALLITYANGLSTRSFQRRLAEERTNFRSLVWDQRRTLAESLMKDRSVTVTAVAHTVGYAETALLSHVFKVSTGASPRAFVRRERHATAGRQ
jgi:AraC-like DNA-binding protein